MKDVLDVSVPVLCEPDNGTVPDHPPDAVHELALLEFHARVDEPPDVTLVGEADSAMVGMDVGGNDVVPEVSRSV